MEQKIKSQRVASCLTYVIKKNYRRVSVTREALGDFFVDVYPAASSCGALDTPTSPGPSSEVVSLVVEIRLIYFCLNGS
jgi:hypothetical protein